jgi:RNA polymerase sigma-70 factor (ECF subfamily)
MSFSRHDRRHHEERLVDERLEAVVVAAGQGEGWALAALYRELHPPVLAYLRAQEPRQGEDLASDTWLKVAAGLPSFRGDAKAFRSWVFTIARCRMIDHRRRVRRRGAVIDLDTLAKIPSEDDPEQETLDAVAAEAALRTVSDLPGDQADVVLLRVVSGLGTDEVATIMGKPTGTIRVLQHRALRRLAKILDEDL